MTPAARLLALGLLAATLGACDRSPPPPGPTTPAPRRQQEDPESAAARAAIEAANQATAAAVAGGDAAAIAAHYADDALMLPAGADFVAGPAAIRGRFQRALDAGLKGLKLEIVSVEAAGDIAVETGRYEATGAGGHHLDHGKYVVTWRRANGRWQAYRDISTSSAPPPVATPAAAPLPARAARGADCAKDDPASG